MEIKVGEFYKTRCGYKAEAIYYLEGSRTYKYVVVVTEPSGYQHINTVMEDGMSSSSGNETNDDLIAPWPKKVKVEGWLNVFQDGSATFFCNKDLAKLCDRKGRVACVKIEMEVEEGEGL